MRSAISFGILAVMATFALAAPTPSKTLVKRSFTVPVQGHGKRSPAEAMARAYKKYGWEIIIYNPEDPWAGIFGSQSSTSAPIPSATESSASAPSETAPSNQPLPNTASSAVVVSPTSTGAGDDGEVRANPEPHDSEYLSSVFIGGQKLNLDFDTGSADLWVYSTKMSSSESSGHSVFDPSKSSSWTDYSDGSWQIQYGDGSTAEGSVGFDKVNVGGAIVKKQCVELADEATGTFQSDRASDGLLGLAFSSINTVQPQPQKTFFENIMGHLDQPVFTADLEDNAAGTYEFGTIDRSKYSGKIHYAPVDSSNGFWQFHSQTYTVGGSRKECTACSPAIADTGTSLMLVDDDVAQAYYSQVNGAFQSSKYGGYVYQCGTSLPDFGVAIGNGYTATIKGADVTYTEAGSGVCFGGVQGNGASTGSGPPIQIYGDVLLKQFFAVFDGGNMRFGIAKKA